jgi:hypothetical protein
MGFDSGIEVRAFEVSQRIHTSKPQGEVVDFLEQSLRKTAKNVNRSPEGITVKDVLGGETLGTTDTTLIYVHEKSDGVVCEAQVKHRGSIPLVIIAVMLLFSTLIGVLLPFLWFSSRKKKVRGALVDVFARACDEFENEGSQLSTLEALSKLATLKANRILTENEFLEQKRIILRKGEPILACLEK